MLGLILIDIQYLQNVVFSLENGSNGQNHTPGSHHLKKNPPQQNFTPPPNGGESFLLTLFGKPWYLQD